MQNEVGILYSKITIIQGMARNINLIESSHPCTYLDNLRNGLLKTLEKFR